MFRTDPAAALIIESAWSTWLDVRNSGWKHDADPVGGNLRGSQLNITGGMSHKLNPDLVVGVVLGYESGTYDSALLSSNLKDTGATVGAYAGLRFGGNLQGDVALTLSRISYSSTASAVTGDFTANRVSFSTGLSGTCKTGPVELSPSFRMSFLSESQDSWTDSSSTVQSSQNFSGGLGTLGLKATYPTELSSGVKLAPYVGVYGDSTWASTTINDTLSGSATAGVNAKLLSGWNLGLSGEMRGFGVAYKEWAGNVFASMPF